MRRAHAVDSNQPAIVDMARKLGFTVAVTSALGKGFVDVALGIFGLTFLAEIKDPAKPPSQRKLTPDEVKFHDEWRGHVCVIMFPEDLVALRDKAKRMALALAGVQ